jgi:acyl carrier protein
VTGRVGDPVPKAFIGGVLVTIYDDVVTSADEIRRELRDLIVFQLVPLEEDQLRDDAQLVDDILDSLGISEIAIFIEDRIGRPLQESEETRTTFATISSIVEFIVKNR